MSIKWIIGLMTAFVFLSLLSGVMEMQYLGTSDAGILHNIITAPQVTSFNNPLTAPIAFASAAWNIAKALWAAFWWDYAFFQGYWVIFKYAIFWPISIGIIIAFVLAIRGVPSG